MPKRATVYTLKDLEKRRDARRVEQPDTCDLRCENSNPLNPCTCSKCEGRCHGSRKITPQHLEALCDRKLRDPELSPAENRFWMHQLRALMSYEAEQLHITQRRRRRRRAA